MWNMGKSDLFLALPVIGASLPKAGAEAALARLKMLPIELVYVSVMLGAKTPPSSFDSNGRLGFFSSCISSILSSSVCRRFISNIFKFIKRVTASEIVGEEGLIVLMVPAENKTVELVVRRTLKHHGAFEVTNPAMPVSDAKYMPIYEARLPFARYKQASRLDIMAMKLKYASS